MSRQAPDLRPGGRPPGDRQQPPRLPGTPGTGDQSWRWLLIVLGGLVIVALILSPFFNDTAREELTFSDLRARVADGRPLDYLVPEAAVRELRRRGLYAGPQMDERMPGGRKA